MTRRVAQDEVGADSGTPQEGALVEAEANIVRVALARARELVHGSDKPIPAEAAFDSLLAYIKQLREENEGLQARWDSYEPGTMEGQVRAIWDLAEHYGHPSISSKHPVGFLDAYIKQLEQQNSLGSAPGEGSPYASVKGPIPEITRCWERVERVLPPSNPTDPEDPSTNLATLAAIAHAKWSSLEGAEAQVKQLEGERDALDALREIRADDPTSEQGMMADVALSRVSSGRDS